jgi:hypothetical protein
MERQSGTSSEASDDVEEKARLVACVKRGLEASEQDATERIFHALEERSRITLEKLIDAPDDFILALRHLLGPGSGLALSRIRRELLLSSVGHVPLNARVEWFLLALSEDNERAKDIAF